MRFERKYRIENMDLRHVLLLLKVHPASFKKIHPDRTINNIYFDTNNMGCANANIDGINIRKKFRVRWYGNNPFQLEDPTLEVKFKENQLGGKKLISLSNFKLDELKSITATVNKNIGNQYPLIPTLLNSYDRSYWGSFDNKIRITIDSNLRFHSLLHSPHFQKYRCRDEAVIMEIKYEKDQERTINRITELFPFRLSKNSKYVNGLLLTS